MGIYRHFSDQIRACDNHMQKQYVVYRNGLHYDDYLTKKGRSILNYRHEIA